MKIKVDRITKQINSKESFNLYSIKPKVETFQITLDVIENWKSSKELVDFAKKKTGYCDSDNGFGIEYQENIDYKTTIEIPNKYLLVFADSIIKKEFSISELDYLKILSQYLISRRETSYANEVEKLIKLL